MQIITDHIEWIAGLLLAAIAWVLKRLFDAQKFVTLQQSRNDEMGQDIRKLKKTVSEQADIAQKQETRITVMETQISRIPIIEKSTKENGALLNRIAGHLNVPGNDN